jgi:transposase
MDYYAGIDVSLELSSVCVVDSSGKVVRETKVASEPEALLQHFGDLGLPIVRVGLEAGPLSQWLREGLVDAGFEVVLLETRHVKAALSAMTVKTDRKDARGIAQLLRMGWYRPVHAKSADAQEVRALLVGRKLLQIFPRRRSRRNLSGPFFLAFSSGCVGWGTWIRTRTNGVRVRASWFLCAPVYYFRSTA